MRHSTFLGGLLAAAVVAVGCVASQRGGSTVGSSKGNARTRLRVDFARSERDLHAQVLPLLNRYCWDCHGDGATKGGLALDTFTNVTAVVNDRRTWERVLNNIESGEMPPKKKKSQPSTQERTQVTGWIERTLFPVDPEHPDPGRVTLHRLNRTEYNNTIRDLVGVDFKPAEDFPPDDVGYGFDNIGDVLSLPPMLLEKYLRAAERVMDEAIVDGPRTTPVRRFGPREMEGGIDNGPIRGLASAGELWVENSFPVAGTYSVKVRAHQQRAGDDPVRMAVLLDGQEVQRFEVRGTTSAPEIYTAELKVAQPGRHRLSVSFLNHFYQAAKWVVVPSRKANGKPIRERVDPKERNLFCHSLEVSGPLGVEVPLPESQRRIFSRMPATADQEPVVAREILSRFTRRAWRRPVKAAEVDRLMTLYSSARSAGDGFATSVKQALTAVLVSPHFLFRGELQPEPNNPSVTHNIDEHALAARLSYFLWSSMPDDELSALADAGKLRRTLDVQLRRMLKDPKARAFTENFAGQWLQLRLLPLSDPDGDKFPGFSAALRDDMRTETEDFFQYVLNEDRPVMDFLTADYTFVNERLALHYGLPGVAGPEFRKVSLAGTTRQGLLTQGSVLTITSTATRTSPVKRGKWVLENILATPPPPPPPNVPPLEAGEKLVGTLRHRMEKHRENAMCASCHDRMDPIGFAFEHFDAVGSFRERDGTDPVEPSGELPTGEKFADHRDLNRLIVTTHRADFLRCLAEKMLTYATGRGLEYYDKPTVAKIIRSMEGRGNRFSALIEGVVHSAPFQQRRGEGEPVSIQVASER